MNLPVTDVSVLDALVSRVFSIEEVTRGGEKQGYLSRYRGRLLDADSEAAYAQLSDLLKPYDVTPLFRVEDGRQTVLLAPGLPRPKPSDPRVNLVMFILTLLSVGLMAYLTASTDTGPLPQGVLPAAAAIFERVWPFTVSLLAILGAHEFGHYLVGRAHGVHVTLPYFIPLPFISPFGTGGAFINMKEIPRNRKVLLDIGVAGPLSGLVVAIPVLMIGLSLSKLNVLPAGALAAGQGVQLEGNSLLYLALKYLAFGRLLPEPQTFGGLPPLLYWLRYFLTGQPFPFGGVDVMIHPVAWAGWGGLLVTAMNLIPAGQLDGGHVLYTLIGKTWARRILPVILVVLVGLGFAWQGWWLWAAVIFLLGRAYAEPLDQITPLDFKRKALGVLALLVFVVTFPPVPLVVLLGAAP